MDIRNVGLFVAGFVATWFLHGTVIILWLFVSPAVDAQWYLDVGDPVEAERRLSGLSGPPRRYDFVVLALSLIPRTAFAWIVGRRRRAFLYGAGLYVLIALSQLIRLFVV